MQSATPDEPREPGPAGLGRRLGAMFYDGLLLFALLWAVTALEIGLHVWWSGEQLVRAEGRAAAGGILLQVPLLVAVVLFFGWFWTHTGQTLGMQAWRLRIETLAGARLSWRQAIARMTLATVSMACLGAGYWWLLFDRDRRCWHDRWTGTRVVLLQRGHAAAPRV